MVKKFERPPFASEVFVKDNEGLFDNLPGQYRHFVRQLIKTGSVSLAAKQASVKEVEIKTSDDVGKVMADNGLSVENLMVHLKDCINAETLIKDKHGRIHRGVDLRIKLDALKECFKLLGAYGRTPTKKNEIDLFEGIED